MEFLSVTTVELNKGISWSSLVQCLEKHLDYFSVDQSKKKYSDNDL